MADPPLVSSLVISNDTKTNFVPFNAMSQNFRGQPEGGAPTRAQLKAITGLGFNQDGVAGKFNILVQEIAAGSRQLSTDQCESALCPLSPQKWARNDTVRRYGQRQASRNRPQSRQGKALAHVHTRSNAMFNILRHHLDRPNLDVRLLNASKPAVETRASRVADASECSPCCSMCRTSCSAW